MRWIVYVLFWLKVENRHYIPIGFMSPKDIASGSALIVPDATPYHLGVLSSAMHMAWIKQVGGRLESRFQYSNNIIYNNYPWPEPTEAQRTAIEECAQAVLDARAKYPASTLADLYDPVTMPADLARAHTKLDRAVDRAYRKEEFPNDRARVEHLFALYQKLTSPLLPISEKKRTRKSVQKS